MQSRRQEKWLPPTASTIDAGRPVEMRPSTQQAAARDLDASSGARSSIPVCRPAFWRRRGVGPSVPGHDARRICTFHAPAGYRLRVGRLPRPGEGSAAHLPGSRLPAEPPLIRGPRGTMTSAVSLFCCQAPSGCYAAFRHCCPGSDRNLWGTATSPPYGSSSGAGGGSEASCQLPCHATAVLV
jgi:hypothetical protein